MHNVLAGRREHHSTRCVALRITIQSYPSYRISRGAAAGHGAAHGIQLRVIFYTLILCSEIYASIIIKFIAIAYTAYVAVKYVSYVVRSTSTFDSYVT